MRAVHVLLLLVAGVGLTSCRSSPWGDAAPGVRSELAGGVWRLTHLGDEAVAHPPERRPYLEFEAETNRISGFTGCNRMFGEFDAEEGGLSFGAIGMTKMACMDTMDLERSFLEVLEATASWRVDDGGLELHDAVRKVIARFERVAKPEKVERAR
jgi:heat shock protein HslJ